VHGIGEQVSEPTGSAFAHTRLEDNMKVGIYDVRVFAASVVSLRLSVISFFIK
jgi:hypothetical protein